MNGSVRGDQTGTIRSVVWLRAKVRERWLELWHSTRALSAMTAPAETEYCQLWHYMNKTYLFYTFLASDG